MHVKWKEGLVCKFFLCWRRCNTSVSKKGQTHYLKIQSNLAISNSLFRITAYLEVKIWSLFSHETMTTGNKIMWKRGEIAPNFSSFSHYFIYIFLTSGVKLHIHLLNVVVKFIVFLTLSTLIRRGTDISKCFSETLWIRDNKSRLYYKDAVLQKLKNKTIRNGAQS